METESQIQTIKEESIKSSSFASKHLKLPRAVPFVLINVLLEKYSGRGTSGILLLYLNRKLNFDRNISTAIFHFNELLGLIIPIFGAIIADSWLGLYKTIKWFTLVFSVGCFIVSVCAIEPLNLPILLTFFGFFIALIGSGCIKVNLNTFGANQYKLPEQENQLKIFFSLQAFFYELGTVFGFFFAPMLREQIKCFGMDDCYPMAFGVSGLAMIVAFLFLLCGKSFYIKSPPGDNMAIKVGQCVAYAIHKNIQKRKTDPREHWLDYAKEKYGAKLVAETKTVMNILKLYFPLPVYWAVYMMQGSRWIFQATRMNTKIGFYSIPPDQIYTLNPLFVMLTLPFCDYVLYPFLEKIKLGSLLHKMTIGIFIAFIATLVSVYIEVKIEENFISILWLVPQYFIFAISDNFMFISHLRFVYTETSLNMKSVMMSSVYLVMASGDLVVILVSGMKLFETQVNEFIFFAGVLLVATVGFGVLAQKYKPDNSEDEENEKVTLMKIQDKNSNKCFDEIETAEETLR